MILFHFCLQNEEKLVATQNYSSFKQISTSSFRKILGTGTGKSINWVQRDGGVNTDSLGINTA